MYKLHVFATLPGILAVSFLAFASASGTTPPPKISPLSDIAGIIGGECDCEKNVPDCTGGC